MDASIDLVILLARVAPGQEMVREKNSSRSGENQGILL